MTIPMNELGRSDMHVHTKYSFDGARDGSGEVSTVVESGIAAGMSRIALCDHCDIDGVLDGIYPPYDTEAIHRELAQAKQTYGDRIRVLAGIELGQPHARPEEARALLDTGYYDFVLGSMHNLRSNVDFCLMHFARMSRQHIDYLVRKAIDESCEIAAFTYGSGRHIDALAHITYIGRYLAREQVEFDFMAYEKQWRELFALLIRYDIALEVNTSGLRFGFPTMPEDDLIALYRDCGGTRFTFGSDAHNAGDVGKGVVETAAHLGLC